MNKKRRSVRVLLRWPHHSCCQITRRESKKRAIFQDVGAIVPKKAAGSVILTQRHCGEMNSFLKIILRNSYRVLIDWIHDAESQSDDSLNNDMAQKTAVNQLSPDLLMTAWQRESYLGRARGLGFLRVCVCRNTCLSLLYLHNSSYFAAHSCYDCLRTEADGGCRLLGCVMSPWDDSETTFCVHARCLFGSNLIPHHEQLLRMHTSCCTESLFKCV